MNGRSAECGVRSAEWKRLGLRVIAAFHALHSAIRNPQSATAALIVFAVLFGFSVPALAQTTPAAERFINIEQASFQPTVQAGRPILTWWDVTVRGSALVEGRFEFELRNEGRPLARLSTEELALTGPQQTIRVVLPPVDDLAGIDQLQMDVTFRGKRFTERLGQQILRVAVSRSRSFMVLTAQSRLAAKRSAERDRVRKRLAFESMLPTEHEDAVISVYVPLEPDRLPAESMSYCSYDLTVLFGDEFRAMKKPQLEALAAWVRAGGRVYVEPTGVLEPYHIDFLRGLTAGDPRDLIFQTDSNGRLVPGTVWEDERLVTTTAGLGRVAVRVEEEEDAEQDFESAAWRRTAAFLWRLRQPQIDAVVQNGQFDIGLIASKTGQHMIDTDGDGVPDTPVPLPGNVIVRGQGQQMPQGWLSWKLPTSTGELLDRLMPEGVRMVPLWLLGCILLAFVVLIGPVDYIGLGWLKARKYTWITFPLATVAVTALTVWVSNLYMSTAEARRGLVIRDVGDDGQIVRTNRFELLFVASSRPVTTEIKRGVFAALGTGQAMQAFYQQQMIQQYGSYRPNRGELSGDRVLSRMTGRIPTQFEVTQELAKWTPQLNRMFWIPGSTDEQPVDWQALAAGQITTAMLDSHTVSGELQERVRRQFGREALVACLGPEGRWAYDRNALWWSKQHQNQDPYIQQQRMLYAQMQDYTNMQLPAEIQQQGDLFRWVYQHSVALPRGLFALASAVAPKGGADLDDLPVHDPSDLDHALLIVVVPTPDDLVVYRKRVPMTK